MVLQYIKNLGRQLKLELIILKSTSAVVVELGSAHDAAEAVVTSDRADQTDYCSEVAAACCDELA